MTYDGFCDVCGERLYYCRCSSWSKRLVTNSINESELKRVEEKIDKLYVTLKDLGVLKKEEPKPGMITFSGSQIINDVVIVPPPVPEQKPKEHPEMHCRCGCIKFTVHLDLRNNKTYVKCLECGYYMDTDGLANPTNWSQ